MKSLFGICLLLAVCAGCSKEEPAVVAEPTNTPADGSALAPIAQPSLGAPLPTTTTATKPQAQPKSGAKPLEGRVDPVMTALLQKFVREKGRLPQSILEMAGATSDGFPLAPAGYLYAIDPATSEVKLVKQ